MFLMPLKELVSRVLKNLKFWHLVPLAAISTAIALNPDAPKQFLLDAYRAVPHIPAAIRSPDLPRVPKSQEELLEIHVNRLTSQLESVYQNRAGNGYMNAWAIAQVGIAIEDAGPSGSEFRDALLGSSDFDPHSLMWTDAHAKAPHVASTSWCLVALRQMAGTGFDPAPHLRALLDLQRPSDGAWALYPLPDISENASTYATAWAVRALGEWSDRAGVADDLKWEMEKALSRGVNWLVSNSVAELEWRWQDYPGNITESIESRALSGLVLHVLAANQIGRDRYSLEQLAGGHLNSLPDGKLHPWDRENSGAVLLRADQSRLTDTVRHYVLPWTLISIVDMYPHADVQERVAALGFIEAVLGNLNEYGLAMEAEKRPWIAAEYLIALRYLQGKKIV